MKRNRLTQMIINGGCSLALDKINSECELLKTEPLRTCNATVETYKDWSGDIFFVLKSYNTRVAAICNISGAYKNYDFLRKVYGYTSTSAQHISKFFNDYGKNNELYRYYPL